MNQPSKLETCSIEKLYSDIKYIVEKRKNKSSQKECVTSEIKKENIALIITFTICLFCCLYTTLYVFLLICICYFISMYMVNRYYNYNYPNTIALE